MKKAHKLLIISPGRLPIPASDGGAVENLLEIFLRSNEMHKRFEILCVSAAPRGLTSSTIDYKETNFLYIKTQSIHFLVKRAFFKVLHFFTLASIGNAFIHDSLRGLGKNIQDFDVVVIENTPEFILPLRRKFHGHIVLHLHNEYLKSKNYLNKKIINSCDEIYGVSRFILNQIGDRLDEMKMHLLHNGIELDKFNGDAPIGFERYSRDSLCIGPDEFVILYAGRITESKGVLLLIEAFNKFSKNYPARLIIAGAPAFKSSNDDACMIKAKSLAATEGDRIIFLGYVDYVAMPSVYQLADVGVVPSLQSEGFGLTVLEHLASGNPVVTTGLGGISEIINYDTECLLPTAPDGFIDQFMMIMARFYNDFEMRMQMSKTAVARAREFSALNYCERFKNLLIDSFAYAERKKIE